MHRIREKIWKAFIIELMLLIVLVVSGLFLGIFVNSQRAIEAEVRGKARAILDSIVMMRSWNAHYDGVYVEKKHGIQSNPYLKNPDITSITGKTDTKKNPSLMTREISQIAEAKGAFRFHITSLKPLNPHNAPDELERQALASFEKGETEAIAEENFGDAVYFRYMGPLYVEESCLGCHGEQGYQIGDVRGGISVIFDNTVTKRTVLINRRLTVGLFIATLASMMGLVYMLTFRLYRELATAHQRIREMAITDELTGLRNRRNLFQCLSEEAERSMRYGYAICLVMFDIDHFKNINDVHGHASGDVVLRVIGETVRKLCRHSDIAGRYGGEEFTVLLPETRMEDALIVAEKLRAAMQSKTVTLPNGAELSFTASFGVACLRQGEDADAAIKDLVERADKALYRAKNRGRNCVECAEET